MTRAKYWAGKDASYKLAYIDGVECETSAWLAHLRRVRKRRFEAGAVEAVLDIYDDEIAYIERRRRYGD